MAQDSDDWLAEEATAGAPGGWRGVATNLAWSVGAVLAIGVTMSWMYGLGARDPGAVPAFAAIEDAPWRRDPVDPGGLIVPDQGRSVFERFGSADAPGADLRADAPAEQPTDADVETAIGVDFEEMVASVVEAASGTDPAVRGAAADDGPAVTQSGDAEVFTLLDTDVPLNVGTGAEPTLGEIAAPSLTPEEVAAAAAEDAMPDDMDAPPEADAPAIADAMEEEMAAAEEAEPEPSIPVAELEARRPEPAADGGFQVQLAALDSEDAARAYWRRAQDRFPELLAAEQLDVQLVSFDEGRLYRARFGAFASRDAASAVCRTLQTRGQDCFVAQQ